MNKKMCLYAIAALVIFSSNVYAQEEQNGTDGNAVEVSAVEEKEIKGNKTALINAQKAIEEKDYQSAIVYLTAYINSKPKKYEPYKLRGDAFYALRQYNLAQNDYQKAVEIKSSDDKFMTNTKYVSAIVLGADKNEQLQNAELGELYARLMYAQKALNIPTYEDSYAKAVKYNSHMYLPQPKKTNIAQINCPQKYGKVYNPQGVDKYIYGAIDDIEKEDYNEALYKTQYITSNYPKYYLGHYLTGVALNGLENYQDAEKSFNIALKYNPYDFESLASLGEMYFNLAEEKFNGDDARKSIEYFKQALKYNPDCYIYYFYIGMNHLQLENPDLAIQYFNNAIKLKENDYNSIYYKLIAQYIKGDYEGVIEGAEPLLTRNLSNRNSVLYLKALALYNSGKVQDSITYLEKIQNNTNDIYNSDIVKISDKDNALKSYVSYLKYKAKNIMGEDAATDKTDALKNPIILMLGPAKKAFEQYSGTLSKDEISIKDYKNYEAFYNTALPKMLKSGAVITVEDIDNQYDYIRTTFSDLGLSFKYNDNGTYTVSTVEGYPYKKYSFKLAKQDKVIESTKVEQKIKDETIEVKKPELRKHTPDEEKIADEESTIVKISQQEEKSESETKTPTIELQQSTPSHELLENGGSPSMAKILATPSFAQSKGDKNDSPEDTASKELSDTLTKDAHEIRPPAKVESNPESESEKEQPFIYLPKESQVSEENKQNINSIMEEEKKYSKESDKKSQTDSSKETSAAECVKVSAKGHKETEDVNITYKNTQHESNVEQKTEQKIEQKAEKNAEQKVEPKVEQIINETQTKDSTLPKKDADSEAQSSVQPRKINEKHANIKVSDFNVPEYKDNPDINWGDEIISLPQENKFIKKVQKPVKNTLIAESVNNLPIKSQESVSNVVQKAENVSQNTKEKIEDTIEKVQTDSERAIEESKKDVFPEEIVIPKIEKSDDPTDKVSSEKKQQEITDEIIEQFAQKTKEIDEHADTLAQEEEKIESDVKPKKPSVIKRFFSIFRRKK